MKHLPLDAVQTAILYDDLNNLPSHTAFFSFVIARLNTALAEKTGMFVPINAPDGGGFGLIGNPQNNLHITVEIMTDPMSQAGFDQVTGASLYKTHYPDLIEAVVSHKGAVLVGVGLGSTPFPLDHPVISKLGMADQLGGDQHQDKFETRLLILQTLSEIICGMSKPSVVHWSQSDQLFEPEVFCKLSAQGFCLPLYIGCGAHSFGEKVGDSYKVGIKGFGSHHLIGHFVHFDTDPRPFRKSYQSVMAFVDYCRHIGRVLDHGETFQEPDGDVITVEHFTTPDFPLPQIMLRIDTKAHPTPDPAGQRPRQTRVDQTASLRPEPPSGFRDMRAAEQDKTSASTAAVEAQTKRPHPTAAPTKTPRPSRASGAAGADRLRQAMQRANTGSTPHSLKTASAQTAQTVGAGSAATPTAPEAPPLPPEAADISHASGEGPTDWIKDHVFYGGPKTNTMQGRLIKIAIACVCLYVIVQVVAPMSDVMSLSTLN